MTIKSEDGKIEIWAVYDGHRWSEPAEYLKKHLATILIEVLSKQPNSDVNKVIQEVYDEFDKKCCDQNTENNDSDSTSTAVLYISIDDIQAI